MRSLREWLRFGTEYLQAKKVADAATDAWILLEYVTNINRSYYYMHMNEEIPEDDTKEYQELLKQRGEHIPVQYLTGEAWFYGRPFRVDPRVLIPRQDTEVLVEQVLKRAAPGMHVLDLCTGSGCILLTILKEASVSGVGSDLSGDALQVAELNRRRLKVQARFVESDLFENIRETFDLIVSNPPYIASDVISTLDPEVREHEPRQALDGHSDGLYFYRRIVKEAPSRLKPGGWLCLEIGYDQGSCLRQLLLKNGFISVEIVKDLSGLDRVALGCLPETGKQKE